MGAVLAVVLIVGSFVWLRNPSKSDAPDAGKTADPSLTASETAGSRPAVPAANTVNLGNSPRKASPTQVVQDVAISETPGSPAAGSASNATGYTNPLLAQTAQVTRYDSKPGTLKVRIEGSSNIHDWQVEGKIIGGYMEIGSNFPTEPGQPATPGKVDARVEAFIPVRSLASVKEDGSPYNIAMDDIMYGKLKVAEHNRIYYRLTELTLKEAAKSKDAPYVFDSVGELAAAGVTNKITMPVSVTPLADDKLRITGKVKTKMTDFKIEPPALNVVIGAITTADEITLSIDWTLARKAAGTAPAAK